MNPENKEMLNILEKLHKANPKLTEATFTATAQNLAEQADSDVDLKIAMTSKVEESSVTIQNFRIDIVLNEFAGKEKRFYNVVNAHNNHIIHQDLALFETAMGIVKKYMIGATDKIQELEECDTQYMNALEEVWIHKQRAKRGINENVALAKAGNAKRRVQEAKQKILKRL